MLLFRVVPLLSIAEIEEIDEIEEMRNAEAAAAYQRAAAARAAAADAPAVRVGSKAGVASRATGTALAILLALSFGLVGVRSAGPAAAATAPAPTRVTMTGVEANGGVLLTAKVTDAKNVPVTAGQVTFLLASSVFGPRQAPIGTAAPDKTGIARLQLGGARSTGWRPTTTGPQEFVASYAAEAGAEPVVYSTNVDITHAKSAYTAAPPNSPSVVPVRLLVKALALTVLTVWLLLITQVGRVLRACRRPHDTAISSA